GDQHRLALRRDEDARYQLESLRCVRKEAEQHERLVEGALVRITAAHGLVHSRVAAHYMVEDEKIAVAGRLGRLSIVPYRSRIVADLGLREGNAQLHPYLL